MSDVISRILSGLGPCLSNVLVQAVAEKLKLSQPAARKRVSRSKDIKRLAYLPFPRNVRFVYLQKDFGSDEFWTALTDALINHSSAYGYALAAVEARNGLVPLDHFRIACGSPIAQKRHLSPDKVLERLEKAQLFKRTTIAGQGECVALSFQGDTPPSERDLLARTVPEMILLGALRSWLRNLGMVSFEKVKVRDERVVSQFEIGVELVQE